MISTYALAVAFSTIFMYYALCMKSSESVGEFLVRQRKVLAEKGTQCSVKQLTIRNLDHYRLTTKDSNAILLCILEAMKDKGMQTSGVLWTTLGTLFSDVGQKSLAHTCFKEAAKLSGTFSKYVKDWSFLGPFGIGKTELDGDPVESFGGIKNVSKTRFKKNAKFLSELMKNSDVQWLQVQQASADTTVEISPKVTWNELVNALGSLGITEWQGWIVGEFAVNENDLNIVLQCLGVHTVYIDNIPVTGDVYHRQKYWYGIQLNAGLHTIYIKLRTKVNLQFSCKFHVPKNSFEILAPNFVPDLFDGRLFSDLIVIPIANYHDSKFLTVSKVVLSDLNSKQSDIINKIDIRLVDSGCTIFPGQIMPCSLRLAVKSSDARVISECSIPESSWDIQFALKFTTSAGVSTFPIQVRCRTGHQSFLFTFLDHDGSVQQAAAIQPMKDCPLAVCPTLLSLHGTTITPQNQADSYKHMVDGKFQFGFSRAWTLAPTRHGAHNWEGPGLLTALSALKNLEAFTHKFSWIQNKADARHVIYAGHSMGGHGAWHIAVHYPDRALALVSLAGWIKKEEYGDSNLFFKHDIATSHVEPVVKSILESCIVENDADQHVSNLHGVPVVTRIGAVDRTVHPWFSRRMYRLLKEEGVTVNHTEVKDKDHWWWDTIDTNDGGAVNDGYLRAFTNANVDKYFQQLDSSGSCTSEGCADGQSDTSTRYLAEDWSFHLVCYNPALGEGMHGVRVLQQITPYRKSEIWVRIHNDGITLQTTNVARFVVSEAPNRSIKWAQYSIQVAHWLSLTSNSVEAEMNLNNKIEFCFKTGKWTLCDDEDTFGVKNRGPHSFGPARRIAESHLKIVIGTQGPESSQKYIEKAAVYISNLFFLTSEGRVEIIRDMDISAEQLESTNVILIGNGHENLHTEQLMSNLPLKVTKDAVSLELCKFSQPRTGVLTLAPNGASHLALLLMGLTQDGLQDIIALAAPTIPPMTRSPFSNLVPDFIVTGPETGRKGPGGYLCTGFYGNRWEYRTDLTSCVCLY